MRGKDCATTAATGRDRLVQELEFEARIDGCLGPDFPEDRRARLRAAREEMVDRRDGLVEARLLGLINAEMVVDGLGRSIDRYVEDVAAVLTDGEFARFEGRPKSALVPFPPARRPGGGS